MFFLSEQLQSSLKEGVTPLRRPQLCHFPKYIYLPLIFFGYPAAGAKS